KTAIHWYQQKENKTLMRMIYFTSGATVVDDSLQRHRYMIQTVSRQKLCILTIRNVLPDDAASYYCAYWTLSVVYDYYYKVFGSGTKLIVSDKGNSAPAHFEILRERHKNELVYVCLIEKFYPGVIRVKWIDEANKEVTQNVVTGDVWKSAEEEMYSVSSWLSVPLENKDKKYFCSYEHESKEDSLSTQGKHCILKFLWTIHPGSTCFFLGGCRTLMFCLAFVTDHLTHKAAQLVYIVLLLKSFMYYVIILLFFFF
ncbi:IGL1 protein, partial [Odontophorus gujanensis]|nr:IGL1 protein [Odontophorus gujanensis]